MRRPCAQPVHRNRFAVVQRHGVGAPHVGPCDEPCFAGSFGARNDVDPYAQVDLDSAAPPRARADAHAHRA